MSESVISDFGSEDAAAQTVVILTQLKAENVDLKRNFENLKGLHIQLSESYKSLQSRYAALYDERNNVEKQYQSLCESWRVELEEKQRHLEAAKAQILGPRDLDVLKAKLLEELEASYRQKCENLTREAESSHQGYIKMRRDYEELQNNYRSLEVRTVGDQEASRLEHTALSRELRDKTAQLMAAQAKLASSEGFTRSLQRDLEAAKYSASQMRAELEEVRRAKERAVVEREAAAVQADKKVKAAEEETAQLMSFVESVNRKNRHLVQELADSQRAAEDLFAANVRLQSAQSQLQSALDSSVRLAAGEKEALVAAHEEVVRRLEERLAAASGESSKKDGLLAEMKLTHQDELTKMLVTWESRLSEEKRAGAERAREILDQKADVAERAAAQQRVTEERLREAEAALRQVQTQADTAAREAAGEALRAEGLSKQLADSSAAAEGLRTELGEAKAELVRSQMLVQQLTERRAELEQRLKVAEEGAVQIRAARDALAAEIDSVRREADEERGAASRSAEAARSAWALEKAALAKRYQAAIKELTVRHESEIRKVKRKARGAHAAVAQLTDEVADLKFKAVESQHVNRISEVLYLNSGTNGGGGVGRAVSPYRDMLPQPYGAFSPPGTAGGAVGGGFYGAVSPGGRPITAPSYAHTAAATPAPNVVIVTGNGTSAGGVAAAAAAGAAVGAAAQAQQEQERWVRQESRPSTGDGSGDGAQALAHGGVGSGGGGLGGMVGGGGIVEQALLSSIAALRQRQQQYIDAARLGVQP
ncbi:hypothetical protein PLESTM_000278900 [Pleodorina starrii]|nr:hypothetical protein PLESTM_000278900 [Pleodorina starrii]